MGRDAATFSRKYVFRCPTKKILNNWYIECFDRSFKGYGSFRNVERRSLYSLTSKVEFQIRRKEKQTGGS